MQVVESVVVVEQRLHSRSLLLQCHHVEGQRVDREVTPAEVSLERVAPLH